MKTVNNLLFLLLFCSYAYGQNNNKTIYIKYQEDMFIKNIDSKISLSFSLFNTFEKKKVNTYNFYIDNLVKNFKTSPFKELRDTIQINDDIKIKTIEIFS